MLRNSKKTSICVVGLGYVGLPLAIQFARSNSNVVGLDIDQAKVDLINRGESYIKHIAPEIIASQLREKRLSGPRIYMDQDACLSATAIADLQSVLRRGSGWHFAALRLELGKPANLFTRWYYQMWSHLPYVQASPVTIGVYGISANVVVDGNRSQI